MMKGDLRHFTEIVNQIAEVLLGEKPPMIRFTYKGKTLNPTFKFKGGQQPIILECLLEDEDELKARGIDVETMMPGWEPGP